MHEIKPGTKFKRINPNQHHGGNLVRFDRIDEKGVVWYTYLDEHWFCDDQSWMYEYFFRNEFTFA